MNRTFRVEVQDHITKEWEKASPAYGTRSRAMREVEELQRENRGTRFRILTLIGGEPAHQGMQE